jgi:hypothetical protein
MNDFVPHSPTAKVERGKSFVNLFGLTDMIRSSTQVDILNSQLKQFEEDDKLDKKEEIEEIIRETQLELRKTRIVCYILLILTVGMTVFINWTPYYFEFENDTTQYFLAYQIFSLLPHFLFSLFMLYLISRNTKK